MTPASLRANAGLIVFAMTVVALASFAHAARNPQYTASSRLLLGPSPMQVALRPMNAKEFDRQTATFELSAEAEAAILPSELVAQRVARTLKLTIPPDQLAQSITVTPLTDAVVEVQASAPDPHLAALLANGFADQYLSYRSQFTRQAVAELLRVFDARSAEAQAEIDRLGTALDSSPNTAARTAADGTDERVLGGDRERLVAVLRSIDLEATRLRAVGSAHAAGGAVISRANPSAERSPADGAVKVGLLIGGAVGGALTLLRRHAFPAANLSADVEAATGMAVLGRMPMFGSGRSDAGSQATPAGALLARGFGTTLRSVVVVAAERGDDFTAVVADLAVGCADAGLTIVAFSVDGAQRTNIQESDGDRPWIERLISVGSNLMVLRGAVPPGRGREMVDAARPFGVVVIEAPPLSESGAAITIGEHCDVVLLVTSAGSIHHPALEEAGRALVMLDRPLQGVVVIDPPTSGGST